MNSKFSKKLERRKQKYKEKSNKNLSHAKRIKLQKRLSKEKRQNQLMKKRNLIIEPDSSEEYDEDLTIPPV
ncbi:hypothetical protein M0813_26535 [Anaeramoeba flamelloides]|uniref:IBB domain-containing protein n=1 Tax=Anaeramoeba flamelloides TaxID=1746091 RepID=A0ABQ8XYQ7_9EUKA|nr:hypothetical protein M0813_26535 [Anaeramoeba flamelloides]